MKKYLVNGKTFEMPPLTLAQSSLTSAFEAEAGKRLIVASKEATDLVCEDGSAERIITRLLGDSMIFWGIEGIEKFFAAILVPEGERFEKSNIDKYTPHMEGATRQELVGVLADFFMEELSNESISLGFLTASKAKKNLSDTDSKLEKIETPQNSTE